MIKTPGASRPVVIKEFKLDRQHIGLVEQRQPKTIFMVGEWLEEDGSDGRFHCRMSGRARRKRVKGYWRPTVSTKSHEPDARYVPAIGYEKDQESRPGFNASRFCFYSI